METRIGYCKCGHHSSAHDGSDNICCHGGSCGCTGFKFNPQDSRNPSDKPEFSPGTAEIMDVLHDVTNGQLGEKMAPSGQTAHLVDSGRVTDADVTEAAEAMLTRNPPPKRSWATSAARYEALTRLLNEYAFGDWENDDEARRDAHKLTQILCDNWSETSFRSWGNQRDGHPCEDTTASFALSVLCSLDDYLTCGEELRYCSWMDFYGSDLVSNYQPVGSTDHPKCGRATIRVMADGHLEIVTDIGKPYESRFVAARKEKRIK